MGGYGQRTRRVVSGAALAQLGSGNYALGTRAWQIRDRLFATDTFAEADMLAIQLDDYDSAAPALA